MRSRLSESSHPWRRLLPGILLALTTSAAAQTVTKASAPKAPLRSFEFTITDLGPGRLAGPVRLNDAGQIGGSIEINGSETRAAIWSDGAWTELPIVPGHVRGSVDALDLTGRIAIGWSTDYQTWSALIWVDGQMKDVGRLGGSWAQLLDISPDGQQIVGWSHNSNGTNQFAMRLESDVLVDLGPAPGGSWSRAHAVNDRGQMACTLKRIDRAERAGIFFPGVGFQELAPIGGLTSQAYDIDANGRVVGSAHTGRYDSRADSYESHAILWEADGRARDLGGLPGANRSIADGLNDRGQIVGYSITLIPSYQARAFLWEEGTLTPLDELVPPDSGWELRFAFDINDRGQIVGKGRQNGVDRGFLLTPVR